MDFELKLLARCCVRTVHVYLSAGRQRNALFVPPNVRANWPDAAGRLGPGWRKCTAYRQTGPSWPAVAGPVVQRGVRAHHVEYGLEGLLRAEEPNLVAVEVSDLVDYGDFR